MAVWISQRGWKRPLRSSSPPFDANHWVCSLVDADRDWGNQVNVTSYPFWINTYRSITRGGQILEKFAWKSPNQGVLIQSLSLSQGPAVTIFHVYIITSLNEDDVKPASSAWAGLWPILGRRAQLDKGFIYHKSPMDCEGRDTTGISTCSQVVNRISTQNYFTYVKDTEVCVPSCLFEKKRE